jgi:hypothetical protein
VGGKSLRLSRNSEKMAQSDELKGGAGFRAVYLKSKYNFDYWYFESSLAGNYLVAFSILLLWSRLQG